MIKEKFVEGVIYDPIARVAIPGRVIIKGGRVERIERDEKITAPIILPGFIDSHIHIESSMLIPSQFSDIAKTHGTVAVVADPHEIANVAGVEGIDYMINDSKKGQIKFFFGAPSCVPASPFDDCFQILDSNVIEGLMQREDIYFLGEMMNFPGVVDSNEDVIQKIRIAQKSGKPIDGHAPGLAAKSLEKYINAGITTDHECFTEEEAMGKIELGMKILIREGSAAKNFDNLSKLVSRHPGNTMFCTDDCHPEDLIKGHINSIVKRSLKMGHNIFDLLQVASVNPVLHYRIDVGLLQVGDPADFIVADNLDELNIKSNFIKGVDIIQEKRKIEKQESIIPSYEFSSSISIEDIVVDAKTQKVNVIEAMEGELITNALEKRPLMHHGKFISDIKNDILKIVVVNRYKKNELFVGFIKGFGLKKGAIAESIAHDSHHIIAVGVDDASLFKSINYIIDNKGGVCYCNGDSIVGLSLPVYGLMSSDSAQSIARRYTEINDILIQDGCDLKAPFMTLSFMALSVIPKLKITPKGLFDINQFKFIDLFI